MIRAKTLRRGECSSPPKRSARVQLTSDLLRSSDSSSEDSSSSSSAHSAPRQDATARPGSSSGSAPSSPPVRPQPQSAVPEFAPGEYLIAPRGKSSSSSSSSSSDDDYMNDRLPAGNVYYEGRSSPEDEDDDYQYKKTSAGARLKPQALRAATTVAVRKPSVAASTAKKQK